uniref:Uncharacterized protein n=1 Tax=Sphenodon punctatus TaxID=8508 RepID=A0A8D0HEE7_SPHPU
MKKKTADYSWKPVPQGKLSPCDRFKHACSIWKEWVYIYVGRCHHSLSDFWRYSVVSNEWERLNCSDDGPEELEEHSMVVYQGVLYVFGGMVDSAFTQGKIPLWMYDIESASWTECQRSAVEVEQAAPANRKGHSAVVYNGSMYIYGGYFAIKGICQEFWALHFGTSEWSPVSTASYSAGPGPRHGHSAVVYGAGMYLFGGLMGLSEQKDFWKWDFASSMWSGIRASFGPPKVVGHSTLVFQDSMLIFGGGVLNSEPSSSSLWKYHFLSQTWKKLAGMTHPSSKTYHCVLGFGGSFQGKPDSASQSPSNCWGQKENPARLLASPKHRARFCSYFCQHPAYKAFSNEGGNDIEMKIFSRPLEPLEFYSFQTSSNVELCTDTALSIWSKEEPRAHLILAEEQVLPPAEQRESANYAVPTSVGVAGRPAVLLLIGGKPLSAPCGDISLWQMELSGD